MSDTPMTDSAEAAWSKQYDADRECGWTCIGCAVDADFARDLELENASLRELERENNALRERVKRLEEVVSAYQEAYMRDVHVTPHDCFATGPRTGDPIQDLIVCPGCFAERKAKEANP